MILFDTSVLVAAMVQTHPSHERSHRAVAAVRARRLQGLLSQHTLAEIFNTLTRYKLEVPIAPKLAREIITTNILPYFKAVALSGRDYLAAIGRMVDREFRGPLIYDALILQAALKKKAEAIYTLNPSDFERLAGNEIAIREPS